MNEERERGRRRGRSSMNEALATALAILVGTATLPPTAADAELRSEEVARIAQSLAGVEAVEVSMKGPEQAANPDELFNPLLGVDYVVHLFTPGPCSVETSRSLRSRLQSQLESAGLDVDVYPVECRMVKVSRGSGGNIAEPLVFDFSMALFSGSVEALAAAAGGLSGVAGAEVTQKGGTSLKVELRLSGRCARHDRGALGERVTLAAAKREVEVVLSAGSCWQVLVPRGDQRAMEGLGRVTVVVQGNDS